MSSRTTACSSLRAGEHVHLAGERLDVAAQLVDLNGKGRDGGRSVAALRWFGHLRSPESTGGSHGRRGRGGAALPGGTLAGT